MLKRINEKVDDFKTWKRIKMYKPEKTNIVNHHGIEFGYELIAAVPFAYYLYLQNELKQTISNKDTRCLYYFSPDHQESLTERHWDNYAIAIQKANLPNIYIHQQQLDWSEWVPPPYNDYYANKKFDFDVCVFNKFNIEWGQSPINFISPRTLIEVFERLKDKKVLYFHMTSDMGHDDTVPSLDLNEWDVVRSFNNVIKFQDLLKETSYTMNELQMRIYANCDKFITVQGGFAILCSFFGGDNIIFAKAGQELKVGSYNWYNRFGGSNIHHVTNDTDLLTSIDQYIT